MSNEEKARRAVDKALYNLVETLGYDPEQFDYSAFNEMLDDLGAYLRINK